MRTLLALLGVIALIVVALMYFGFINIDQTRPALVQAPQFKADVARVSVGTEKKTVEVPTVNVERPGNARRWAAALRDARPTAPTRAGSPGLARPPPCG